MLLFAGSWLGQFLTQLTEVLSDLQTHGQPFTWGEYLPQFFAPAELRVAHGVVLGAGLVLTALTLRPGHPEVTGPGAAQSPLTLTS